MDIWGERLGYVFVDAMNQGLSDLSSIRTSLSEISTTITTGIAEIKTALSSSASTSNLGSSIADGINESTSDIDSAITNVTDTTSSNWTSRVKAFSNTAYQGGADITSSYASGMKSTIGEVEDATSTSASTSDLAANKFTMSAEKATAAANQMSAAASSATASSEEVAAGTEATATAATGATAEVESANKDFGASVTETVNLVGSSKEQIRQAMSDLFNRGEIVKARFDMKEAIIGLISDAGTIDLGPLDGLKGIPSKIGEILSPANLPSLDGIKGAIGGLPGYFSSLIPSFDLSLGGIGTSITNSFSGIGNPFGDLYTNASGAISGLLSLDWYSVGFNVGNFAAGIINRLTELILYLKTLPGQAWEAINALGTYIYNGLMSIPGRLTEAWNKLMSGGNQFITWLSQLGTRAWNSIVKFGQDMYLGIMAIPEKVKLGLDAIGKKFNDFIAWLGTLPEKITTSIKNMWTGAVNYLASLPDKFWGLLAQIQQKFWDFINWLKGIPTQLYNAVKTAFDNAMQGIKDSGLGKALNGLICAIVGCSPGLIPALQQLGGVASKIMPNVGDLANDMANSINKLNMEDITATVSAVTPNLTTSGLSLPVEQVNACLLYTSPSPRDRTRSRMPSSA
jgi:hypothetical protein